MLVDAPNGGHGPHGDGYRGRLLTLALIQQGYGRFAGDWSDSFHSPACQGLGRIGSILARFDSWVAHQLIPMAFDECVPQEESVKNKDIYVHPRTGAQVAVVTFKYIGFRCKVER